MDIAFSLALGLVLRLTLKDTVAASLAVPQSAAHAIRHILVGIWEGVCLYHQTRDEPFSPDPYLAHFLRLLYDLLAHQSSSTIFPIMLWTILTMFILSSRSSDHRHDITNSSYSPDRSSHRRTRRSGPPSRSVGQAEPPRAPKAAQSLESPRDFPSRPTAPLARQLDLDPDLIAASASSNQSFFTPINDLTLPSDPDVFAELTDQPSPCPKLLLTLPTPPITPEHINPDVDASSSSESPHRLSTVPEGGSYESESPSPHQPHSASEHYPSPREASNDFDDLNDLMTRPIDRPSSDPWHQCVMAKQVSATRQDKQDIGDVLYSEDMLQIPAQQSISRSEQDEIQAVGVESTLGSSLFEDLEFFLNSDILCSSPATSRTTSPLPLPSRGVTRDLEASFSTSSSETLHNLTASTLKAHASDLRQQASTAEKGLQRLEHDLRHAVACRNHKEAFLLRMDIRDTEKRIQRLHERAARRQFHAVNMPPSTVQDQERTISIQGLFAPEALRAIEKTLRDILRSGTNMLRVIIDQGSQCTQGVGMPSSSLRPAIINHMKGHKMTCTVEPGNPGVLVLVFPES